MKKIIDDIIILKTKKCSKNFECLLFETQTGLKKKVDRVVSRDVLFVHCNERICHYYLSSGNSVICNCPTRKEIYKKYNF